MPLPSILFMAFLASGGAWAADAGPSISVLVPPRIVVGGADFVLTVTGSGFLNGATLEWNQSPLATTWVDSTRLSAAVPAALIAAAGNAPVAIANPDGTVTAPVTFTIDPAAVPALATVNPGTVGPGIGPFTLTVNGSGFLSGALVQFDNTVIPTTFVSDQELLAQVPAALVASAGLSWIEVINPPAVNPARIPSNSHLFLIGGSPQLVFTISPTGVPAGSPGFTLTVNGFGFGPNSVVQWNGSPLPTTLVSGVQLTALVGAGLIAKQGTATVQVTTGGAPSASVVFNIYDPATPRITAFDPLSAVAGSPGFQLTVTGTGFAAGAVVQWNGTALTTTFVSGTQALAQVPAALLTMATTTAGSSAGQPRITVVNPGGTPSDPVAFPVMPLVPTVLTVNPTAVAAGSGPFTLTVTGSDFDSAAVVRWFGTVLSTTFVSSTELQAQVTADLVAIPGTAPINVLNPQNLNPLGQQNGAFTTVTVSAPPAVLSSISPTEFAAGAAAFTLTVNGSGFFPGTARW